jgi:hypothetical protein
MGDGRWAMGNYRSVDYNVVHRPAAGAVDHGIMVSTRTIANAGDLRTGARPRCCAFVPALSSGVTYPAHPGFGWLTRFVHEILIPSVWGAVGPPP